MLLANSKMTYNGLDCECNIFILVLVSWFTANIYLILLFEVRQQETWIKIFVLANKQQYVCGIRVLALFPNVACVYHQDMSLM